MYLSFTGNNQDSKINITSSLINICPGKPAHFTAHAVNGGTEPIYTWYLNGVELSGSADTITVENLQNNDQITCRLFSRLPCIIEQYVMSNTITMHTYPNGTPSGFLPAEMTKCVNLYEKIKPLTEFASYLWSTGATTPSITIHNPGEYWLEVTDLTGCKGKEYTTITTRSCMNAVYIPSAFTPNKDGRNDIFKPLIDGKLIRYEFSIYDRWGQCILRTKNPDTGWDGKRNGIDVGGTVYIWTCTYQLEGEAVKTEKGTVAVIR
ncbi:MAG: gliding motility-associated C-terminal domain-containing protein [Chitinophagaceae bacterium]|nr:gliding motility-associated C-terminal domain-containing protein [Chitinophagaceae bacterium]